MTSVILFPTVMFGKKHFDDLQSRSLFSRLEKTNIRQKEAIAGQLVQWDDAGIGLLIRGLSSKDEATALACQHTLKQQLTEWQSLPNDQVSSRYLAFSKELADHSKDGTIYAQQLFHELAVRVQKDTLNRGFEGQHIVSQNCQKMIDAWQVGQRDQTSATKFKQPAGHDTTLAGAGEPRNTRVSGINVPYLVAQSADTNANDPLRPLAKRDVLPADDFTEMDLPGTKNQNTQTEKSATRPRVGFYSLQSPVPAPRRNDQVLIARSQPKVSPFLTERLQQVGLLGLPKLPTQDLMRLIYHPNRDISQQSEAILQKRDGFQEEHLQLAKKLYHPDASARKSLLSQLANNEQLETCSWLSELLKDPDREVRLATAKAIYGQIPLEESEFARLQSIMQSDADPRIAGLGNGNRR